MLSQTQLGSLQAALIECFPTRDELAQFLNGLEVRMDRLVKPDSLANMVTEIVAIADRAGWLIDLVRSAYTLFPSHRGLATLHADLGLGASVAIENSLEAVAPLGVDMLMNAAVWREQLARVERQICRIEASGTLGTGFLVGPDLVLTTQYMLAPVGSSPTQLRCRFDFRRLSNGEALPGTPVGLASHDALVVVSEPLDYALLRLERRVGDERLDDGETVRGWVRIPATTPNADEGAPLVIVHHPGGQALAVGINTNAVVGTSDDGTRLRYHLNTLAGSGGAPCFGFGWDLIAMHEGKVPGAPSINSGIRLTAIRGDLERRGLLYLLTSSVPISSQHEEAGDRPPRPGPILHADDPQLERWGHRAERDGRKLTLVLGDVSKGIFAFNAVVSSTDGSPIEKPVVFHIHDTFPKSAIWIRAIRSNTATLEEVIARGAFVVGAQVKDHHGRWIGLEANLVDLPDLPKRFKDT